MSPVDERRQSAYGSLVAPPSYAENPFILRWWSPAHDEALRQEITRHHWLWYWHASNAIVAVTPGSDLEEWKKTDPLCGQYAWYNILMYFAVARAQQLGLTTLARQPTWRTCAICTHEFREDSLSVPLVERLGIDHLDICGPCLKKVAYETSGNPKARKDEVLNYVRGLTEVLQSVPHSGFGDGKGELLDLTTEERVRVYRLLCTRPTPERVKRLFGAWLGALVAAGVLEGGARKTSRGIQSLARDGHACYSLGEKTIDDFLFRRGVAHEREPAYPEGAFRGDFKIRDVIIEYLGLAGDPAYDAKTKAKEEVCRRHGIRLILVLPADLATIGGLEDKLNLVIGTSSG